MAAAATLSSASGILSLLDESDVELQTHGLKMLDSVVDEFWSEIAPAVPKIETMYEDESFANRDLAAFVASKVFYHLEELDDALKYALGAGNLFDVETTSQYVETLISKCVDEYIRQRSTAVKEKLEFSGVVDERLEAIVEKMFERCFADGKYEHAVGIAVESRRLDIIQKCILISGDIPRMLEYVYGLCTTGTVQYREFKLQILRLLVDLYSGLEIPNYFSMCQCLLYLNDHETMAEVLIKLIENSDEKSTLTAYQMAFDLYENQNVKYMERVLDGLPAAPAESEGDEMSVDAGEEAEKSVPGRMKKLKTILDGSLPTSLYLHFLYGHSKTDLGILQLIKDKSEVKNSVAHTATIMAHSIMNAGTTLDVFLRDNLEWLGRANNWAKFTAISSIGVIHLGHHEESMKILDPYLPKEGVAGSPYQSGGSLYALGLIHQRTKSEDKTTYLLEQLANAGTNEIVQHGACLGLGLLNMGSNNNALCEKVLEIVYSESAVAGEAAGITLGLILLGSGKGDMLDELLKYARKTQHLRIVRGLALGVALIVHGQEEEADVLIEEMINDDVATIRFGGIWAIAMAYVATSSNSAIEKLLHVAVSDVDEDVRRAAVTALGFVLCNNPEQVPKIVSLLAESYSPYVRQGACMAVGIACAGRGQKSAVDLLEPLVKDRVDFVRQAALIGLSMVVMQENETSQPAIGPLRKKIMEVVEQKGDSMTKFGAILGAGILDAGGRNMTIGIMSANGHMKRSASVGLMMFPLFWYWHPYMHFLSLSLEPTAVVGLNANLKMPAGFKFCSNAAPSAFAYPPPVELKKKEEKKEVKTATLSVTAKAKAKAKRRDRSAANSAAPTPTAAKKEEGFAAMEVEIDDTTKEARKESDEEVKEGEKSSEQSAVELKKKELPYEILSNPARATWQQQKLLSYSKKQRYVPVKPVLGAGVVLLMDSQPGETEELVVSKAPKIGIPGVSDDEPDPPEPFEFTR